MILFSMCIFLIFIYFNFLNFDLIVYFPYNCTQVRHGSCRDLLHRTGRFDGLPFALRWTPRLPLRSSQFAHNGASAIWRLPGLSYVIQSIFMQPKFE